MFINFPSNPFNNPLDAKSSIFTNLIKTLLFLFHQKPECFGIHYEVVTIYKLKRNIEKKYVKINNYSNPNTFHELKRTILQLHRVYRILVTLNIHDLTIKSLLYRLCSLSGDLGKKDRFHVIP